MDIFNNQYGSSISGRLYRSATQSLDLSDHAYKLTEENLEQLRQLKSLKKLKFRFNSVNSRVIDSLASLAELEELDISSNAISNQDLSKLATLPNLRSLNLNRTGITGVGFNYFQTSSCLRSLSIHGNPLSGEGLKELSELSQLEYLTLWTFKETDLDNLHCLGNLKALKSMDVSGAILASPQLSFFGELPNLQELSLGAGKDEPLSEQAIESLSKTRLKTLHIITVKMTPQAWTHLCQITSLENLELGYTSILSDADQRPLQITDYEQLVQLVNLQKLEVWGFTHGELSNTPSCAVLPVLQQLDNLEYLDFRKHL